MANKLRGEVDFPEAGEGIVLRCLPSALAELSAKFGSPVSAFDPDTDASEFAQVVKRITRLDAELIIVAAKLFAKKGDKKDIDAKLNVDSLEMPFTALRNKVLDAIMLGVHGKTLAEMAEEVPIPGDDAGRPSEGSSGL